MADLLEKSSIDSKKYDSVHLNTGISNFVHGSEFPASLLLSLLICTTAFMNS